MQVQAAVLNAPNTPLNLETLSIQDPQAGELLIKVLACGVCHTDISVLGRPFPVDQPMVLGHEGVGVVVAVGHAASPFRPGDRVVMSFDYCGTCVSCLNHAQSYCQYFFGANFLGQRSDGSTALSRDGRPVRHKFFGQSSFATHCVCSERNAVKVPQWVSDELLPLLGPLGCGFQTGAGAVINVLKPQLNESVVIFGSGAVGMAAIMAAKALGAGAIIAVDRVPDRIDLARELGATHALIADGSIDIVQEIKTITQGGAQCSLDTTAVSAVLRQALDCLGPMGRCGFVGGAPVGTTLEVDVRDVMMNGKSLRGIVEGDSDAALFIPELLELHKRGLFPFEKLIKTYAFENIQQAIDDAKTGITVKPVLLMP